MLVKQNNGVEIVIQAVDGGQILFDITQSGPIHERASSMRDGSFYQNLTVKEAKEIRKALKAAIKEATA